MAVVFWLCGSIFRLILSLFLCLELQVYMTEYSSSCSVPLDLVSRITQNHFPTFTFESINTACSTPVSQQRRHAPVIISASLHHTNIALLWCRPRNSRPFLPRVERSISCSLCALLLLFAGDVELNPGPAASQHPSTLNLGCLNICSARNKVAAVHDLIADFSMDCLALCETRLQEDLYPAIKNDVAPSGYDVLHVHRPATVSRPSGGGLAFIYRDNLVVKPHPVSTTLAPSTFELQLLRVTSTRPPLTIVNIYRPPATSLSTFSDELADTLSAVSAATTDRLLLCGDLNSPGVDAVSINSVVDDVFGAFNLQQHVREPTRLNPDHLLDVIVTDSELDVCNVRVDSAGDISDHRLVVVSLSVARATQQPIPSTYRRLKNFDVDEFEDRLRASDLFVAPATTADGFARQLQRTVVTVLDELAPVRSCRRRPSKPVTKWLSSDAIEAKRLRRRLEKKWKVSKLESDRIAYRAACRRANELLTSSRQSYFRDQLNSATDAKSRWKTVKQLLHSDSVVKTRSLSELQRLCTDFATFFTDKITAIKRAVAVDHSASSSSSPHLDPAHIGSPFYTLPLVTPLEVGKLLRSIPPKTCSMDFIPTALIKSCPAVFSDLIATLANLSFSQGVFPEHFKAAAITPLLKKPGSAVESPSNYRPISNLNNISKLLERLFLVRIQSHITSSPNFSQFQSAYRQHHSTESALLHTFNNIYTSADRSQPTLLMSLDLSAAFDTIDHSLLLNRLHCSFGISGTTLDWLTSYLTNRTQVVRLGQASSGVTTCTSGVPQGSVLGPLLFSIYTSPIAQIANNCNISIQQYADDTQLYITLSSSTINTSVSQLEHCLASVHNWFSQNGMCLNSSKSEAILLGTRQRLQSFPIISGISVASSTTPLSPKIKTLGVTIDQHLTLDNHVNTVCRNAHYHLRALRHIRSALTVEMAAAVAVSLVQSRLDYANSLLYDLSSVNIGKLQRVQNMAARIVLRNSSTPSSTQALHILHWLPVRARIKFKIASLTYKTLSTCQPAYLRDLIHPYLPARSLRSQDLKLLNTPRTNLSIGRRAFSFAAPHIWNSIPISIRDSTSLHSFKRHLKTFYFQSSFA